MTSIFGKKIITSEDLQCSWEWIVENLGKVSPAEEEALYIEWVMDIWNINFDNILDNPFKGEKGCDYRLWWRLKDTKSLFSKEIKRTACRSETVLSDVLNLVEIVRFKGDFQMNTKFHGKYKGNPNKAIEVRHNFVNAIKMDPVYLQNDIMEKYLLERDKMV
jgi:hypothetical protein